MNLELKNKVAVVSGSTGGIGFGIATALAAEGAHVVVTGRTELRIAQALDRIKQQVKDATLLGVGADLGTAHGVKTLLEQVPRTDILVNNLGVFEIKSFMEITDADWLRLFEVNVLSGVRLSRGYLPGMVKDNWGRIIFVSSESGQQVPSEMIHYGVTKTAQIALARGLAEAVTGTGVTVNSVLAGPTASEGVLDLIENITKTEGISIADFERQFFTKARPTSLLKRFEMIEEVAAVVAFIASPRAIVINGAAVRAEGGIIRSIF